jgi:hypothetical protein
MPMQIGTFHSQHCQVKEKGADLRQHDRKVFLLAAIIFIEPAFIGSVKKKSSICLFDRREKSCIIQRSFYFFRTLWNTFNKETPTSSKTYFLFNNSAYCLSSLI